MNVSRLTYVMLLCSTHCLDDSEFDVDVPTQLNVTLWPSTRISYRISSETDNPQAELFMRRIISASIEEFTQRTCIQFAETSYSKAHESLNIVITSRESCFSGGSLGREAQPKFELGRFCTLRAVLKKFMYALGVPGEERRLDRDKYISVQPADNDMTQWASFHKYDLKYEPNGTGLSEQLLKLPYDYVSVTHAKMDGRTKSGLPRFLPWYTQGQKIGIFARLSDIDVMKLHLLYRCSKPELQLLKPDYGRRTSKPYQATRHTNIRLWPDGVIPYVVESGTMNNPLFKEEYAHLLEAAMRTFNEQSCVPVEPRRSSLIRDYLVFVLTDDCTVESSPGLVEGPQRIPISNGGCYDVETLRYLFGHIAGITSDLQRSDRDRYFKANWDELVDFPFFSFTKRLEPLYMDINGEIIQYDPLNEFIDYNYIENFFHTTRNSNGTVTLLRKKPRDPNFTFDMSRSDVEKIQHLYNCTMKKKILNTFIPPFDLRARHIARFFTVPMIFSFMLGGLLLSTAVTIALLKLRTCLWHRKLMRIINQAMSDYGSQHCENMPYFDIEAVRLEEILGKGNFGVVHKAKLKLTNEQVAVKIVQTEDLVEAAREARIPYNLQHDNIVRIRGMAVQGKRTMLILELMDLGSLNDFLQKSVPPPRPGYKVGERDRVLEQHHLLHITYQIACGLSFMASKNVVHRDLAAKNCLVSSHANLANSYLVKISDFGLSRRLYNSPYYNIRDLPGTPIILAPECLQTLKYTQQSDMWSFGLTMWEVFSFGQKPFGDLTDEVVQVVQRKIVRGGFPDQPEHCPDEIYGFMKKCSSLNPNDRPSASFVEGHFGRMLGVEPNVNDEMNENEAAEADQAMHDFENDGLPLTVFH